MGKVRRWLIPGIQQLLAAVRTHPWKASLGAVTGLCLVAASHIFLQHYLSRDINRAGYSANRELAKELASHMRALGDTAPREEVLDRLARLAPLNRTVRIYVTDKHGIILAAPGSATAGIMPFVDIQTIRRALAAQESSSIVYGDDPKSFGRKRPISVAPIRLGADDAYLYVVGAAEGPAGVLSGSSLAPAGGSLLVTLLAAGGVAVMLIVLFSDRLQVLNGVFAGISHDLKAPLASIQGYLETLLMSEKHLSPAERREFLTVALHSTQALSMMVHDLLQLARLDTLDVSQSGEVFDLTDLIEDSVITVKPRAEERRVGIAVDIETALPLAWGDLSLVSRVVQNVLENAVRYNNTAGQITIHAHSTARRLVVRVEDSGIGIAPHELRRVTEPYYRGKNSRSHASGTGLGLAIAKKVINLHEGKFLIESTAGKGTTVTFDIPRAGNRARGAAHRPAHTVRA